MRAQRVRWIEWAVAVVLLCTSITAVTLVRAPRWAALAAGEVADGHTPVAVGWDGTSEIVSGNTPGATPGSELTVVPAAEWYVRPGLHLTSPDRTVRIQLQQHPRPVAERLRDDAVASMPAGSRLVQHETLVTGAEVHMVSQGTHTVAVLELPCLVASTEQPGTEQTGTEQTETEPAHPDEVLWVTVTAATEADLARTRVALGQLLETVCQESAGDASSLTSS